MGTYEFSLNYSTIHPYIALGICCSGIAINIVFIAVLLQKQMRTATNMILVTIAISDFCLMTSYMANIMSQMTSSICTVQSYIMALFVITHANMSVTLYGISTWLTISLALLRYRIVRSESIVIMPSRIAFQISALVMPCTILACTPIYVSQGIQKAPLFEGCVSNATTSHVEYRVQESTFSLKHNSLPLTVALWNNSIIMKLIPCILLSVFIILLVVTIQKQSRRRRRLFNPILPAANLSAATGSVTMNGIHLLPETVNTDRINKILISILVVFLICQAPQGIINFVGAVLGHNTGIVNELGELSDDLSLISSSVNFFLYCSMSTQFRNTFCEVFRHAMYNRATEAMEPNQRNHKRAESKQLSTSIRASSTIMKGYGTNFEETDV